VQQILGLYFAVLRFIFRSSWALGRRVSVALGSGALRRKSGSVHLTGQRDYRGLYQGSRPPAVLASGEFPVGRFVNAKGRTREVVGIPESAMRLNACVIGPPGAGKTRFVIVPWIVAAVRAGYSVVTLDVKGDMLDLVRQEVRRQGQRLGVRARSLDYTRSQQSLRWNWLDSVDSDRAVDSAVQSILGRHAPPTGDPYFYHLDSQILRGLLELVMASPRRSAATAQGLLTLLKDQAALDRALRRYPSGPAVARLQDLVILAPDDYSKRITGVTVRLDALARPTIQAVTTNANFSTEHLLKQQELVSVVAPLQDGQMAQTLSSLFVNDLLFRVYNRFTGFQGPRVLLMLDEAAQLTDRIDYKNLLSVARSAGVSVVLALQDVSQFADLNERSIALGNCGTFVCFSGVSQESAKFLSERLGSHTVPSTTLGQTPTGWGYQTTVSTTSTTVPVLGPREIMSIPFGTRPALVHSRPVLDAPFLVDLG
jgi:type IV secretory pathway TraG/TraD family ATPase VirD4